MINETTFDIKDPVSGRVLATHHRIDRASGKKKIWWTAPDGSVGLPSGTGIRDLPLYQSEIRLRERSPLLVVEGEKSVEALAECGIHALGTVTGAGSAPSPDALIAQVYNRVVLFWPDNDEAGFSHADQTLAACRKAGAKATGIIDYQSTLAPLPPGYDAADMVGWGDGALDPALAREVVGMFIENWARSWITPTDLVIAAEMHYEAGTAGSVTDALYLVYGIEARPGKTVRCPMHGDRSASLWIATNDDRAICMTPSCLWSSPGADANDVKNIRIELR